MVFTGTMLNTSKHTRTEVRNKTSAPIASGDSGASPPEFGRIPDVTRLFGLRRGYIYLLIHGGKIKSVSLRNPGSKFGCRLIHLQSVRDFLAANMDGGTDGKPTSRQRRKPKGDERTTGRGLPNLLAGIRRFDTEPICSTWRSYVAVSDFSA